MPGQEGTASSLLPDFDPAGAADALSGGLVSEQLTDPAPEAEPFFTINNLATLLQSTAFTALVGRVPNGGEVFDPIPIRILVGRENLAASGYRVPNEIASMVFGGIAVGDYTLSCVTGELRTATFIFEDGTIRTVTADEGGRLGVIADRFGVPCISGERVSNAGSFLAASVALAAGAGAAEAFSQAEVAQVVDDGAVISAVVGDAAKFALGNAASEGLDEVQQYLADRLRNTFDAIFVPAGAEVGILIEQEIAIDYDPNGRRLVHARDRDDRPSTLD